MFHIAKEDIGSFLDLKVEQYNQPGFIQEDPVSVPHLFTKKQDREIIGFYAAILAWGQRKTIIQKSKQLAMLMESAPYDFILNHQPHDLKRFEIFRHRTFNYTDTLYFIHFFRRFYELYDSLETAFVTSDIFGSPVPVVTDFVANPAETYLANFRKNFFGLPDFPERTKKHVSSPEQRSTCKRLNMFLRWMVRKDDKGVDFGIWEKIKPSQLICPVDLHVERVARGLNLIRRRQVDWFTALELTERLRELDPDDPVKYDFALFGLGVEKIF